MGLNGEESPSWRHPHAFHLNLPAHHHDEDGVPLITKYAYKKSRNILRLVDSMQLTESMLLDSSSIEASEDDTPMEDVDVDDDNLEDDEGSQIIDDDEGVPYQVRTLNELMRACSRLSSQLSSLETLKHCGLSQRELCQIVLHILKLATATFTLDPAPADDTTTTSETVTIHYENVGYICTSDFATDPSQLEQQNFANADNATELETDLSTKKFALPSPGREVLLSMLVNMLSNKGPLRSVSNAAIYPEPLSSNPSRFLLILHWQALLRTLLRTAPYLDEHKVGNAPTASNSRQNTTVKRAVQLIRDARHFFDQGLRPNRPDLIDDRTARAVWEMVKTDVMYHSHTHACYRSLVLLYLFQPSRCTSQYYLERMPLWFEAWTNIDRCPEIDFLYLALFCRARKHMPVGYDWGGIRRRLLTHSQYWLQLPIGGASLDKSFPNAAYPRSRSCPSRLKVFAGASSSYEEGIDFVAKVAKLLVIGLGTGEEKDGVSEGSRDVLRFLNFVTPYFNPSNLGSWTFTLGAFLHYFCYELCCRVGSAGSMEILKANRPGLVNALCKVEPTLEVAALPPNEIVELMDALLPLCQQALYSKNGHVGRAGEAAMLYLCQIDPARVTPAFIDFATRALGISAVNLAHQAPAALSALTRLLQPALRSCPKILLVRLPEILQLTLAGIDSNDQNKTIRTLILYRSLTSWVPVGGTSQTWKKLPHNATENGGDGDGTLRLGKDLLTELYKPTKSAAYKATLQKLPESSLMKQGSEAGDLDFGLLLDEAAFALSDWVLEFLERVYSLLRATGEREKAGKTASGVASRHSSADVQQARNFSRVLKECLIQTFAAMDDEIHSSAVKSVARFLTEETLPSAAKDTSLLCQAASAVRLQPDGTVSSPGLDTLIPLLTDGLEHHSNKTVTYRLRCLSGAVRSCGVAIKKHREPVFHAIGFALGSKDKHVYKTGCKVMRHTLATCCESYAFACDSAPRVVEDNNGSLVLGQSAQLHLDPVRWHIPDEDCVLLAWRIIDEFVLNKIRCLAPDDGDMGTDPENGYDFDFQEVRRCLRVIRYALRGGGGILLDADIGEGHQPETGSFPVEGGMLVPDDRDDLSLFPYEGAVHKLLKAAGSDVYQSILSARGRLCTFVVKLSALIASETFKLKSTAEEIETGDNQSSDRKYKGLISTDSKICKETSDVSLLLLTRRGAAFRSQEGKTIWKAQKQLATDFALLAEADHTTESLQRAGLFSPCSQVWFKDGENAGKTLPRRLLIARIQLFHDSLQRTASFEVPRRLRKLSALSGGRREIVFSTKIGILDFNALARDISVTNINGSLATYEAIVDGLFSLCCHSNTQVRASAIGVVDYAITRYGWLLRSRVPRLLSAVNLKDEGLHAKFGIPSCAALQNQVDGQGKRKRLAEVMKGVCSILAIPRAGKLILANEKTRLEFVKTICGTEDLVSIMPPEEMQKMVHYLHSLFSPFRSKFYGLQRATQFDKKMHRQCIEYLLDTLSTEKEDDDEGGDAKAAHWRKLMHACWFLTVQVDEEDLQPRNASTAARLWKLCFQIIEDEYGQPLQRVALGLFGRLVMMTQTDTNRFLLRDKMITESFSQKFGNALVYDHKEDSSVGGGHDAQWAAGVADMIRDSARNVAPRSLFPFQRTNQSSGTFKISHAQLVEQILLGLGPEDSSVASRYLLAFAKDMASSPPSEDQRNQQCTSAEIFAGVSRASLQALDGRRLHDVWKLELLPFLDEVVPKIPISLSGAYFDSLRFAIQFSPPKKFFPLTSWLFEKVEGSLWDPSKGKGAIVDASSEENNDHQVKNSSAQGTDGFTSQSKWLYLCCSLLVELDETEIDGTLAREPWYTPVLCDAVDTLEPGFDHANDLKESWKLVSDRLLPRLTAALGHPYESCRDHIAGCLFRICYCHRKMARSSQSRAPSRVNSSVSLASMLSDSDDPGSRIVQTLLALQESTEESYQIRYNSLITARRFFSYCIHFGEAKHEYSDYIIPLLPLAFEALNSTIEDTVESTEAEAVAKRALEAEVVKGYRHTIAEVSVASVMSYGGNEDISRVVSAAEKAAGHEKWQVRHASANFLRCFQGSHKFLFTSEHAERITAIAAGLLSDERREVSSAAMAAVTGIIAALPLDDVAKLVKKYATQAKKSTLKRKKKAKGVENSTPESAMTEDDKMKEQKRAKTQQSSVFFLCATVLSQPYDTPPFVPKALAAISKHSFERNAPLGVREIVKKCCAEYKRTHMSDNWELHRKMFTQEEIEALEDVVSSPHYYA